MSLRRPSARRTLPVAAVLLLAGCAPALPITVDGMAEDAYPEVGISVNATPGPWKGRVEMRALLHKTNCRVQGSINIQTNAPAWRFWDRAVLLWPDGASESRDVETTGGEATGCIGLYCNRQETAFVGLSMQDFRRMAGGTTTVRLQGRDSNEYAQVDVGARSAAHMVYPLAAVAEKFGCIDGRMPPMHSPDWGPIPSDLGAQVLAGFTFRP